MNLVLSQVYAEVANKMGVALFEINAISARELNAELENKPPPYMAYFAGASGSFVRALSNSTPFVRYENQTVYFIGRPADESPDSLQSTERQLLKMANEFVQLFSRTDAFTMPENEPFAPAFRPNYPVFDARLMEMSVTWSATLDLNLPPVC